MSKRGTRQQQKVPGTFPILSNQVICQCMNELGMKIDENDLKAPKRSQMTIIYENFVDLLMGVSRDDAKQPDFAVADVLEHQDLHESSIGEIMLIKSLCKLMDVVGITDFSMTDVTSPNPKRTKRALSALINFAKFREEQIGKYTEQTIATEELLDRRDELEITVQQLEQKLTRLQAQQQEDAPVADQVAAEVQLIENEVNQLNKKQAALQSEIRKAKEYGAGVAEKVKNAKQVLSQESAAAGMLKAQIVDDPEHVRRVIADMKESLGREREAVQAAEAQCHALQERLNTLVQISKEVARAQEAVKMVGSAAARRDALADEMRDYTNAIAEHGAALREQSAAKQNIEYSLEAGDEKQRRLRQAHAERRAEAQKTLSQCRKEKMESDKERLGTATKINQQEIAAKQLVQKAEQASEAHAAEMAAMRIKMDALETAVQAYHHRLSVAMTATGL